MADLIAMLSAAAGAGGAAPTTDPFFNQTVLLLHGDGTNGAQNNTFLDSSTNNFTITRNGNTTQGTFSPFSLPNGEWSNYFDGSGDNLSIAANSAFLYTGDFTVEMWVYPTRFVDFEFLFGTGGAGGQDQINIYANGTYVYFDGTNSVTSPTLQLNAWNHIAVTRSGTTIRAYANGVSGISQTKSGNLGSSVNALKIGERSDGAQDFNGYISNLRVVNGTAVYTGATHTVPTAPLTAIANTSLLTCQSNRFVDNSTNNFAITVNGNTSVQPFSPFLPSAAYSTSMNGGSGYFDGTGDYLSVPDNVAFTMGSGNFTIEFWAYTTTINNQTAIMQINSGGSTTALSFGVQINTSKWRSILGSGGTLLTATASANAIANQWNHIAFVRNGNTGTLYINGTADGTVDLTGVSINDSDQTVVIGGETGGGVLLTGWIASCRVVKGTAVYTSAFTPPTAPVTAVSGTSLLCNYTNAGIFDNTGKNNLETVGNAQIDTTTKKYGTGSMEFDGSGDYLDLRGPTENFIFGTGDFTIEFWMYLNSTTSGHPLDFRPASTNGAYPTLYITSNTLIYYVDSSNRITSSSLSTSTWYHVAISRSGTSTKMFIDGTQSGSTYTDSTNYLCKTNGPRVGANDAGTGGVDGYIDDLRITKGVARYTAAFTPPTQAFPDL